ncbi:hypothetical protein F5Y14DRAFT_272517 [Nemania sp. NC0429]|nr:hypothetical protein F5Y14DRAFT_272517 [Nemania sp. NC0429]
MTKHTAPTAPSGLFRCRLADDAIVVDIAPGVAEDYAPQSLEIRFKRTIRVPDNAEQAAYLPPGLGDFSLFKVGDYATNLPLPMATRRGGVFFPIYQREAMWIDFAAERPFMIKIYAGGVNVVSGKHGAGTASTPRANGQDYVVVPGQRWLDGFAVAPGVVRQFVAMPMGAGYSVEAQLTGEEVVGGLLFEITPSMPAKLNPGDFMLDVVKVDVAARTQETIRVPCSLTDTIDRVKNKIEELTELLQDEMRLLLSGKQLEDGRTLSDYDVKPNSKIRLVKRLRGGGRIDSHEQLLKESMGVAAGGKITQAIYKHTFDPTKWAKSPTITIPVHILTTALFRDATGRGAPPCPISVATYAEAGLPFFDLPETPSGISGSFGQVKSVNALSVERGLAQGEDPDVRPRVVKIPVRERQDDAESCVNSVTIEDPDGLVSMDGPLHAFRT